jgi:hypothetical protein
MLDRKDEAVDAFKEGYKVNGEPFLAFLAQDPRVEQLQYHREFSMLAKMSKTKVNNP